MTHDGLEVALEEAVAEGYGYSATASAYGTDDDTLDENVKAALDALSEGQLSSVITTDSALYIVRVDSETDVDATIIKYVGKSRYSFTVPEDTVEKEVHWYLMMGESYYSKPQREEYFVDSGFYKYHEAYHLLKFANEKQILEKAYNEYLDLKRSNLWGNHKYF